MSPKISRRAFLRAGGALASTGAIAGYLGRDDANAPPWESDGGSTDDDSAGATGDETDRESDDLPLGDLTEAELDGLRYVREEEKLAHDVYTVFEDRYGLTVFSNIAASEQEHVDAMGSLLEKYDVADPFVDELGVFTNDDLQSIYDAFVDEGRESVVAALGVGGEIEEVDVVDLAERIEQTDNPDIARVYENLMDGSKNHLRAFVDVLDRYDVEYEPRHLDDETYESILDGEDDEDDDH